MPLSRQDPVREGGRMSKDRDLTVWGKESKVGRGPRWKGPSLYSLGSLPQPDPKEAQSERSWWASCSLTGEEVAGRDF